MLMNPFTLPAMALAPAGGFVRALDLPSQSSAFTELGQRIAGLPFDALRAHYAWAVKVGLMERSMIASRDFERSVGALEQITCGPMARRV